MVRKTIYDLFLHSKFTDSVTISEDLPRNITLGKGDMLALRLIAKGPGSGYFIYKWRKVNDTLPTTVEGEDTQNLTIRSVIPSDSGSYYCNVTNQWGNTVRSKTITVNILCKCIFIGSNFVYKMIITECR